MMIKNEKELINPIEEYVKNSKSKSEFLELFEASSDDIVLKTDLNDLEVDCVNKIHINNVFLKSSFGGDFDIYGEFLLNYMKVKISFNRQSRIEFVDVNRKERFEQNLSRFNNFQNLEKVKQ